MQKGAPTRRGKKLRIAFVFALVTIAGGSGSYGYHLYRLSQDFQFHKPQPQVERLARDLRQFHAETHRFPATFVEINARLWHTQPPPNYGHDGRRAWAKNYYYFFTRVNENTCVFWALPVGPQREYGTAFFVVLSPDWIRVWKGPPVDEQAMTQMQPIPSPRGLSDLKMQEISSRLSLPAR